MSNTGIIAKSLCIPLLLLSCYNIMIASAVRQRISRVFLMGKDMRFKTLILENYNGKLKLQNIKDIGFVSLDKETQFLMLRSNRGFLNYLMLKHS